MRVRVFWCVALVAAVLAVPATAAAQDGAVTLVTGDRVLVREGRKAATVIPAHRPGRKASFRMWRADGELHVVPTDVARLVPRVLDPALFNVTALMRMGYDDARSDSLPLIVRGQPSPPLRSVRALRSVGATAVEAPKGRALPLTGLQRVWLDARLRGAPNERLAQAAAELDANLTQIRAPAAWAAGLRGDGVKVAVLDTGLDATHPDLRGKLDAEADFTGEGTTGDPLGAGTHAASIIAGTGAAADGARKGVAFGARLLNARILNSGGGGTLSGAIAAMEWAAAQGAKVAHLGFQASEDPEVAGPLIEAIDRIGAQSGVLFVAGSGDWGTWVGPVLPPGTAGSALTVGSVFADDRVTSSSGRGEDAIKPDVTAPGVRIAGARAAGTPEDPDLGEHYASRFGTLTAAAHAAGAAAVLAGQHPGWRAEQLKAALVTTASPHPDHHAYDQGGGRIDLAQATTQPLQADRPHVDFGFLRYPQSSDPVAREITLSNPGAAPVDVDLAVALRGLDGQDAPDGMVAVSPARQTVPAGGSATATVTLRPQPGAAGRYGGAVTVTPAGGGTALRLPVGVSKEPERYDVRLRALDRNGAPFAHGAISLVNRDDVGMSPILGGGSVTLDERGEIDLRLDAGRYAMFAWIPTPGPDGEVDSWSATGDAEAEIRRDGTLVLDARRALPSSVAVRGRSTTVTDAQVWYSSQDAYGRGFIDWILVDPSFANRGKLFIQPTASTTDGFEASTRWRLEDARPRGGPEVYDLYFPAAGFPDPPRWTLGPAELARLAKVRAHYRPIDPQGDTLEVRFGSTENTGWSAALRHPLTAPRERLEAVSAGGGVQWRQCLELADMWQCERGRGYERGERAEVDWLGAPLQPDASVLRYEDSIGVTSGLLRDSDLHTGPGPDRGERLRLYREGTLVGEVDASSVAFPVPPDRARFRLEQEVTHEPGDRLLPTAARTAWTFTSTPGPAGEAPPEQPLLQVQYRPLLDERNRLPANGFLFVDLRLHYPDGVKAEVGWASDAELRASVDDGRSWRRVSLLRIGKDRFVGWLWPGSLPRGARVSLRAEASDGATGSTIDQRLMGALVVRTTSA